MKKILLMFILLLTVVGCATIGNNSEYTPTEPKLSDNDLIGIWDNVVLIENGFYISSYYFYGNNKCSMFVATSTASGMNVLADTECSYSITDLDIYIDGSLSFRYDEYNDELMRSNNNEITYIKTADNPCSSTYSHC